MTGAQKVFNKVVRHLRRQGKAAMVGKNCAYRVPETSERCAAGCLIPNKLYNHKMEGWGIDFVLQTFPQVRKHFVRLYGDNVHLIEDLQQAHDSNLRYEGVDGFESEIQKIANRNYLTIPKK